MAVITLPTEKQGTIDVFEEDGNINIVFFHERLELTRREWESVRQAVSYLTDISGID